LRLVTCLYFNLTQTLSHVCICNVYCRQLSWRMEFVHKSARHITRADRGPPFHGWSNVDDWIVSIRYTDIDECSSDRSPCEQVCVNEPGTYRCTCHQGFSVMTSDRRRCIGASRDVPAPAHAHVSLPPPPP